MQENKDMAKHNADRVMPEGTGKRYEFHSAKVKVRVPKQADNKDNDVSVQSDDESPATLSKQTDFTPRRAVINLVLDKGGHAILPAAEIEVQLTAEDYSPSRGPNDIKMAYWYGGKWVLFGAKHKFRVTGTGADYPGSAFAEISVWGDPPIAIG
jgi:hypothetical protein